MKNEFIIKKCSSCGAMVKVFKDCTCKDCGIKCCGEEMKVMVPNSVDAAKEKHVPTYQVYGEKIATLNISPTLMSRWYIFFLVFSMFQKNKRSSNLELLSL